MSQPCTRNHPLKEAREALLRHGAHFLFSTLTIDTISARVRRLVQAFLRTCVSYPVLDVEYTWREEARFAAPPELAMYLRCGLACILRVSGGDAIHGLIPWDMYCTSDGVPNSVRIFSRIAAYP